MPEPYPISLSAVTPQQRLKESTQFGTYTALKACGQGTYGTVYMVKDQKSGRIYAGKMETIETTLGGELKILQTMNHATIQKVVEASICKNGLSWIVLPYIAGTLHSFVRDHSGLRQDGQVALFLQLLSGLDHIHTRQIIHADIKPSNILYDVAREAFYIIDFGLAFPVPVPCERKRAPWLLCFYCCAEHHFKISRFQDLLL